MDRRAALEPRRRRTWSPVEHLPAGILGPIKNKPLVLAGGTIVSGTSMESYDAWTSWVERSQDGGLTWSKHGPILYPGENYGTIQPAIVPLHGDRLRMFVRSTERIGRICYADSADRGVSWSELKATPLENPNSGIDAVGLADGRIVLVYNPSTSKRTPLSVAVSRRQQLAARPRSRNRGRGVFVSGGDSGRRRLVTRDVYLEAAAHPARRYSFIRNCQSRSDEMNLTRRGFLSASALGVAAGVPLFGKKGLHGLKIGVTDWNLHQSAKPEAVALAKQLGFQGVEVSLGTKIADNKLPLDNPELQAQYLEAFKKNGIGPAGTCLDALPPQLPEERQARAEIGGRRDPDLKGARRQGDAAAVLRKRRAVDPARDGLRGRRSAGVGPTGGEGGRDPGSREYNLGHRQHPHPRSGLAPKRCPSTTTPATLPTVDLMCPGRSSNSAASESASSTSRTTPTISARAKWSMTAVLHAIAEIEYRGFANLETDSPSKSVEADMKRNLTFVRRLMSAKPDVAVRFWLHTCSR